MQTPFNHIVVYGRQRAGSEGFSQTLNTLVDFLKDRGVALSVETETAAALKNNSLPTIAIDQLKDQCDLMIVIGGDGSLLHGAHSAVLQDIPVIGINRGSLGFLTDIAPNDIHTQLGDVLHGNYRVESRFLLKTTLENGESHNALNDVVLMPGNVAQMLEFDIEIGGEIVSHQRADGLIVATPTGSTAYALSGGGPIIHPSLDAVVLVPMFPHTLSSRPIVVGANSIITVRVSGNSETDPLISCDGGKTISIASGSSFTISKFSKALTLIHPTQYNYYETLRSKLKWETKLR